MAKKQSAPRKTAKKSASKKTSARAIAARKSSAKKASAKKSGAKKSAVKRAPTKKSARKTALLSAAARKSSPPTIAEQIEMRQSSEYVGHNRWNWSIWIDAPATVMNDIEYVDYKLHSSYTDPLRRRTNRDENFRLSGNGWGEFTITAEIKPQDGKAFTKRHWLTLEYPATPSSASSGSLSVKQKSHTPTIFVSAGVSDLRLCNALAAALRTQGFTVFKGDEVSSDLPWEVAIGEMIKAANLMVVLLSGRPTSWTIREIYAAIKRDLTILPVLIGPDPIVPGEIEELQAIKLKDADKPEEIAPELAMQVIDKIKKLPPKP